MTLQWFLISQVCSIVSLEHILHESFQFLVLILGFWSPLKSVIGICQNEDQSCANESQGSHYEAEKKERKTTKQEAFKNKLFGTSLRRISYTLISRLLTGEGIHSI